LARFRVSQHDRVDSALHPQVLVREHLHASAISQAGLAEEHGQQPQWQLR
jgi:hypothetical protein